MSESLSASLSPSTSLEGKTVLITGANRGIGRALTEEALQRGAAVVYAGTRKPFSHADPRVRPVTIDLADPDGIRAAAKGIDELDVLVNNAGIAAYDDLSDPEVLRQQLAVNVFGPLEVTNAFVPALTRSRGAIVTVSSTAGLAPLPFIPSYSISKAAVLALTQAHRALLAPSGVRVHAVLAGPVDTEMSKDFQAAKASPRSVAAAIFDGLAAGQEEIFPDPAAQQLTAAWADGASKVLERSYAELLGAS
ncbi:MAG: SDR family NAD(P)-dependent oxidoreductase [Catenulispora sp.]|nr:SDR family NAD(P)-dependent oxidoreductase [Catenulispora sp.]